MNGAIKLLVVSWILCCCYVGATILPAVAQAPPVPSGPEGQYGQPRLSILSPITGRAFGNESIVLDLEIENFELVQPEPRFGEATKKPVGHLHIYLDSNPLIATSSKRIMIGNNIKGEHMPVGWHSIVVELVDEDHNVLNPRIYKQIQFYSAPAETKQHIKHSRKVRSNKRSAVEDLSNDDFTGVVK